MEKSGSWHSVMFSHLFHIVIFYILKTSEFFFQCRENGAFSVVTDNYVKEEEGTGVVHQAPYFGAVSLELLVTLM